MTRGHDCLRDTRPMNAATDDDDVRLQIATPRYRLSAVLIPRNSRNMERTAIVSM